jgi:hypothetical protein
MLRCPSCRSRVVDEQALLCGVASCGYKRKLQDARPSFVVTFCTTAFLHVLLIVGLAPDSLWRYWERGFRDYTALTFVGTTVMALLWYFVTLCTTGLVWVCIVRPILEWRGSYEPWSKDEETGPTRTADQKRCKACGYRNRIGCEFYADCGVELGPVASKLRGEDHPLDIAEARN